MKKYDHFIFDLYGTLATIHTDESQPAFWEKIAALLVCYDAFFTPDELKDAYSRAILETGPAFACQYPEFDAVKAIQLLLNSKGASCSLSRAQDIAFAFRVISREHLAVYPGVRECLENLKCHGKAVYLLSNAQKAFTMPELKLLKLDTYFDDILLSSDYGTAKPDPLYYGALIRKHHLNPSACLMTGNDPVSDILGGTQAGMDTLYFHSDLSAGFIPPENATYQILSGDFTDAGRLLAQMV